ncbi:MAG: hypothetical protein KDA32_01520 [Phycisphaerales bacterium]|nr:hypothetical protein [Phycisphaerales bacterium]
MRKAKQNRRLPGVRTRSGTRGAVVCLVTMLAAAPLEAGVITFPVGAPVTYNYQTAIWTVERGSFVFWRYGGLSINQAANGAIHAGGLLVGPLAEGSEFAEILRVHARGAPFRLESIKVAERNYTTGLRLIVYARDAITQTSFDVELPFDLDMQTYDAFDMIAIDSRFTSVDYVSIQIESPFVDPVFAPYIIDEFVATILCPADLDGDDVVGLSDLAGLLANFGSGTLPEDGDLDGDGDVDLSDLSALLGAFGTVCG